MTVQLDSRKVRPGDLFVALRGSRADGHDFVADACARGAVAVLCEPGRVRAPHGVALLEATDPRAALATIAREMRRRSRATVVGIAGSAGKTSTKDILRSLCAPHRRTVATHGNENNELGVPLTLCRVERETEVVVCELGTGGEGEIAALCRIAEPDAGIVTNVGPEHLEHFGGLEDVARAEAELLAALPSGAPAVLPFAEPLLDPYRRDDLDTTTFGLAPAADVYPLAWRPRPEGTHAVLAVRGERVELRTNLRAPHHRLNLCAAVAAYTALGLPLAGVGEGAAAIALSPLRDEEQPLQGGGLLINDAYNAHPGSMAAALVALVERAAGRRSVAVLGEMAELGAETRRWHRSVGALTADLAVDVVVGVGPLAREYGGAHWFRTVDAAAERLPSIVRAGDVVLLKASRAARLERLAPVLR